MFQGIIDELVRLRFLVLGLLVAMLAIQVEIGPRECNRPSPDDMRPYTLCLAETSYNEAERKLQHVWRITIARVRVRRGGGAASRLRSEQRQWDQQRHRQCADQAGDAPVSEQARAELTCLYIAAGSRTVRLAAIAKNDR